MLGRVGCVLVVAAGLVAGPAVAVAGAAPSTVRVSVSSANVEANAASGRGGVAISANGRYVAFISDASNLVPGDGNGVADVFVRDMRLHTTERVSVSSAGVEANGAAIPQGLAISPDGRFVTFMSVATNLAPACPFGCQLVYLRDRRAGTTRRIRGFASGLPVHMVVSLGARFYAFDTVDSGRVRRCRRTAPAVASRSPSSRPASSSTTEIGRTCLWAGCPPVAASSSSGRRDPAHRRPRRRGGRGASSSATLPAAQRASCRGTSETSRARSRPRAATCSSRAVRATA